MDKIAKEKIKELKLQGEYDEIFRQYGMKIYAKHVPASYRKEDLKKLKNEGRYEDIFNKYGKYEYSKILIPAMYNEIKENKGTVAAALWRTKEALKLVSKKVGLYSLVGFLSTSSVLALNSAKEIEANEKKYKQEIQEYNDNIQSYAEEMRQFGFSDVQVFMKVMDDMWNNIKGYANPKKDIMGFLELDLATPEGYGVCRNMSSDVAKKLNEINPKYNARTMTAYIGHEGKYQIADIATKIYEPNETVLNGQVSGEQLETSPILDSALKVLGNHMVTLVDVPEDNLTIVLDPTNPGIGVYMNGEITMLNSDPNNEVEFDAKEWINAVFMQGGIDGIVGTSTDYIKSFEKPKITPEQIAEKYGVEAQNRALDIVRTRVTAKKVVDKSFDERYRYTAVNHGFTKNMENNQIEQENNFER